jgi:DNA-binding transcriptional regulator YdaS (Cro superfamily)
MSKVEAIERAIEELGPGEFAQVVRWIDERRMEHWKQEMDADAAAGKLDFLFAEADDERNSGKLTDWPGPS